MAAAFLLGLLLIASARTAAGDHGATLPHLELPVTPASGRGQGSAAPPHGLMDIMSMSGCGRFAGLVAETADARDVLEEQIVADRGLTVFCPEDKAVDAFEPTFRALADRDRLAVLLLHGVAARYGPVQLAAFEWVELRTLAVADAATNKSKTITIRAHKDGDTLWLWPSPRSCNCGDARIIKTISSEEGPLAVHLVDGSTPYADAAVPSAPEAGWRGRGGGVRRVSWLAGLVHSALESAELRRGGHPGPPGRSMGTTMDAVEPDAVRH